MIYLKIYFPVFQTRSITSHYIYTSQADRIHFVLQTNTGVGLVFSVTRSYQCFEKTWTSPSSLTTSPRYRMTLKVKNVHCQWWKSSTDCSACVHIHFKVSLYVTQPSQTTFSTMTEYLLCRRYIKCYYIQVKRFGVAVTTSFMVFNVFLLFFPLQDICDVLPILHHAGPNSVLSVFQVCLVSSETIWSDTSVFWLSDASMLSIQRWHVVGFESRAMWLISWLWREEMKPECQIYWNMLVRHLIC